MVIFYSILGTESHYGRNKSQRLYLSSEWNITKLWKAYNATVTEALQVKRWFFNKIFATKFNIGFGTPATDQCSYCLRTKFLVQNERDLNKKNRLMSELGAHRLRAKTFYRIMKKETYGTESYCMDLQQVQPLPKLSIGEAFYARQISLYNLCITDIGNQNPIIYSWTENQAGKGANEVSSALYDFLSKKTFDPTTTTLRIFADGCGGQNKNAHVVHVLTMWLLNDSPEAIKNILMVFPVRGHSYLPADRVFGRIERETKCYTEITELTLYREIYSKTNEVRVLGEHWEVRDMKYLGGVLKKTDGIAEMKRIFLKKKMIKNTPSVVFKMEPTFCADDDSKKFQTLLKRGQRYANVRLPNSLPFINHISSEKKRDVLKLLDLRFGDKWLEQENLNFYKFLVDCEEVEHCNDDEHDGTCNCMDEEPGMSQL